MNRPEFIPPEKLGFDIDGVVADTMDAFIRIACSEYGINHLEKEDITSYWLEDCLPVPAETVTAIVNRLLADPLGVSLKPISGAGEALTELAGQALLTFVTARPVKEPIEKWLSTILQGVPLQRINVIATGHHSAKGQVLRDLGIRYFVEDHLETCQELFDMGIGSIVFDQPWNRKYTPYLRVRSWTEIMALIR